MRSFFALLLLGCICLQWLAGSVYLKIGYAIDVSHVMNAAERGIGRAVARELGLEVGVRVLAAEEVARRAIGYNGFFAFSEQIEGEEVYYTLERDSLEIVEFTYRADRLPNPDAPAPGQQTWQRLFPQFRSRIELPPTDRDWRAELPDRNFTYLAWRSLPPAAPSPPPPERIS